MLGIASVAIPTAAGASEQRVFKTTGAFAQAWSIARQGAFMQADLETDANIQVCDAAMNESDPQGKAIIWAKAKQLAAESADTLLDVRVRSIGKLRKLAKKIKNADDGLTHHRKGEIVRGYVHAHKAINSLRDAAEEDRLANVDIGQESCGTALGQHQQAQQDAQLADNGYEVALNFFISSSAGGKP